jgi:hypothetical protein
VAEIRWNRSGRQGEHGGGTARPASVR